MPSVRRSRAAEEAGFGRRLAAYLLDVWLPYAVILAAWALGSLDRDATNTLGAIYLVALVPYLVWSWMHGATLGMAALGVRIEAEDGGRMQLWRALLRLAALGLMQLLALVVVFMVLDLALVPPGLNAVAVVVRLVLIAVEVLLLYLALRRPYWHDRVSRTTVLQV